ncbi:MAG: UPF0280 family protein [Rhodobacteraceae bacterium]|nr:UPF0280 family protein [Paracoccaceae bacterium]MCF8516421.1 UPF0280 family protein [Paracoccaceae bacterium]MCF8520771.1 UPF0280 family protein [Paracoccaceae bacterium]
MTGAEVQRLPDGRLHMHHGPIDIIAQCWGDAGAISMAEQSAIARFDTVLAELASELPELRRAAGQPKSMIGQRMARATAAFHPDFITPMAAVAGSVAEEILACLAAPGIQRAYANNGGDIALYLTQGESLTCAVAGQGDVLARVKVQSQDAARGIATSGWRGRSWSFGIADSVTVLARTAAMADAAATMIANAVTLGDHPAIQRRPACDLQADSDLGDRPVTVQVGPLTRSEVATALLAGQAVAQQYKNAGLIEAAALFLHPEHRTVGSLALEEMPLA